MQQASCILHSNTWQTGCEVHDSTLQTSLVLAYCMARPAKCWQFGCVQHGRLSDYLTVGNKGCCSKETLTLTNRIPVSWVCTPAGGHEADKGFRAVFRDSRPVGLIHHHEKDLPHSQALKQAGARVHLPHCITKTNLFSKSRWSH